MRPTSLGWLSAGFVLTAALLVGPPAAAHVPLPDNGCDASAVPDWSGDCTTDVVVGAPGWDVGRLRDAGAVQLTRRAIQSDRRSEMVTAGSLTFDDDADARFGASVLIGDFDDDGSSDIAIGAPGTPIDGVPGAGAVYVLWRGQVASAVRLTQLSLGGRPTRGAGFGSSLAWWPRLTAQGQPDSRLVVGAPGVAVNGRKQAGAVVIVEADQIAFSLDTILSQGSGAPGLAETGDRFGAALAVTDSRWLAVGAPGEDVGKIVDAGSVTLLGPGGAALAYSQNSPGVPGAAERGDHFGAVVSAIGDLRLDDDTHVGVLVSAPDEKLGRARRAGAVSMFYTTSTDENRPS